MKILHITECYAGGVSRAIEARVSATPEHSHHLLWSGDETPQESANFSSSAKLPNGLIQRIAEVRKQVRNLQPDVIHAHSSWAGVYARILKQPVPVVYEPHCFKFDDPRDSKLLSRMYFYAEKALVKNTTAIGILSEHEKALAYRLSKSAKTFAIPNISSISPNNTEPNFDCPTITMIGRIAKQKDPQFFIASSQELLRKNFHHNAIWIGDGEPSFRKSLEANGIEVTGWVSADEIQEILEQTTVYLHTASYEGFPLSVLDAASQNRPIIAREIPSLKDVGIETVTSPHEAAQKLIEAHSNREFYRSLQGRSEAINNTMNTRSLRKALIHLYEYAHKSH